ncbi:hypothetical protein KUTeg_011672 [Tegillarca granosa]|uniref:LRRNT domain-containing protein n=1 Tax=Tegillarca granosa TaxID=220873 RepID=A0ABQ9F1Q7_TEGGR|nr:hypothetical protein KUTeg_011672 [Tegillarca granosa]
MEDYSEIVRTKRANDKLQLAKMCKECPASCQCANREINCNGQRLTSVPSVLQQYNYDKLDLSNNFLTVIGPDAFAPFGVKEILLSHNNITHIENYAFRGLENKVEKLDISNNKLTVLPDALSHLNTLSTLDVSGNPIPASGFTEQIMRAIGNTLTKFVFGHPTVLTKWPSSTSHFPRLTDLELNGAYIFYLPQNSFHSFERTLTNLTIKNTQMSTVPLGLSRLPRLTEFHFDHNLNAGDDGIIEQSFVGLSRLRILSLRDNGLNRFPFVLKPLVELNDLSLDDNKLLVISDEAVKYINNSRIQNLRLVNCSLDRIPGAITGRNGNLQHLQLLDFSKNNIKSLDRTDLQNLHSLQTLSLAGNKNLSYVSDSALSNLPSLEYIDFSNTHLQTIPNALKNIPNLRYLNLLNDDIECTCDLVDFKLRVDTWPLGSGRIIGNCATISSNIRNYLDRFVVNCPDYVTKHATNVHNCL